MVASSPIDGKVQVMLDEPVTFVMVKFGNGGCGVTVTFDEEMQPSEKLAVKFTTAGDV